MAPPTNIAIQAGGFSDPYRVSRTARETERIDSQPANPAQKQQTAGRSEPLQELTRIVDGMNERAQNLRRSVRFSIERELNLTVVKVINPATDEVIRQIPSEEFIEKAKTLEETRSLLFEAEA